MVQIIPTLLATTEEDYKKAVDQIETSGHFREGWVQIDLMDNKFVPNKSVDLEIVAKFPINSKLEAQLMVIDPGNWFAKLADLSFSRIIFPIEDGNTQNLIDQLRKMNLDLGLSLNPETSVEDVLPFIDKIDVILVMSVHPGFQKQKFTPESLDKIKELSLLKSKGNFIIGVDGGITPENAKDIVSSGADYLAIGSHLFNGDLTENMEKFWEVLR